MAAGNATPASLDEGKVMLGILALLVAEREERLANGVEKGNAPKTELLLASAGFSAAEIARVTGKNYEAVRKTIQRGRN